MKAVPGRLAVVPRRPGGEPVVVCGPVLYHTKIDKGGRQGTRTLVSAHTIV